MQLAGAVTDPHVLLTQIVLGQAVPRVLQWAKGSPRLGWLGDDTELRNKLAAAAGALVAVGFAFGVDGAVDTGMHVVLTIPPITDWPLFAGSIYAQYQMQKGIYHGIKQRAALPAPQEPPRS